MQNDTCVGIRKKELFQAFGVLEQAMARTTQVRRASALECDRARVKDSIRI